MHASCTSVINHTETIQNIDFFLKPGITIALNQISFTKKPDIESSRIVNIYCDSVLKNVFNPKGVLKSIPISSEQKDYFFDFQDGLIFSEIGYLNNEIRITIDAGFKISYFQLVVKPNKLIK